MTQEEYLKSFVKSLRPEAVTARKSAIYEQKTPGLMVAQVYDGEWAVVSDDKRKPLTEIEAQRIIAAYLAVNELSKSII